MLSKKALQRYDFFLISPRKLSETLGLMLSGHRIVAGTSPRMTTQDAADGEIKSFHGAVLDDGLSGVFAASGRKAARRAQQGRDGYLIKTDGQYQQPRQESLDFQAKGVEKVHRQQIISTRVWRCILHSSLFTLHFLALHFLALHFLGDSAQQVRNTLLHFTRREMVV